VTVEAEQMAEVAFTLEGEGPPPGTLVVRTEDAAGDPVPGACYDIAGEDVAGATSDPRCDDDGDGLVEFPDLAPGDYAVRQTTPADDAAPADPVEQTVAVEPGAETEVAFQTPAGFGTVDVRLTDAAGDPVGFCAELVGAESPGPVCDDGAGDADPTPGTVRFAEVPVGASEIRFSQVPEPFAAPEPQPVTVARDETATVDVELQRGLGTLVLFVEDPAGEALPSTCVTLQLEDSGAPGEEICDQGDDGRLNLPDLPAGTYTVRQTRAAEGYEPAPELTVEVPQDATTEETVVLAQEATPAPPTATPEPAATATPEPTATGEPTEQPASPPPS
jgi:uncharacterized surface anchored protein